ncbi:hypothetical protein GE09DRAFT_1214845 [Coniochaeta sp. 2T2.1]|nr:hypothetical protein GE09DRAFT_1214845 [Coniochaeta sp. 2T2.1]
MLLSSLRIGTTIDPTTLLNNHLVSRDYYDEYYSFWYTRTGVILKWSLFWGILLLFSAYMIGGYIHAKKRMAKGLPLLRYHRWLVPRRVRAQYDPGYAAYAYPPAPQYSAYYNNQQQQGGGGGSYQMYPMPPPVYDPNAPRPPVYAAAPAAAPNDGMTKS